MPNNVPFSKIPQSDLADAPDEKWVKSVVGGLNESMLALSSNVQNIEIKTVDVVTPDPWIEATQQNAWAGKGGLTFYMRHYDGSVQIRGFCTGGVYVTTAFTLPVNLRPPSAIVFGTVAGGLFAYGTIGIDGQVTPLAGAAAPFYFNIRFMPANNRPQPLKCFPINVKTKFKAPPMAVIAIKNQRVAQDSKDPTCTAMLPSWRFINSESGPTVQVTDIPGLEYGCRQRVTIAIIGG